LIAPLYHTHSLRAALAAFSDKPGVSDYDAVRANLEALGKRLLLMSFPDPGSFEKFWRKSLNDGVVASSAFAPLNATLKFSPANLPTPKPAPADEIEFIFRPDPCVYDGRFANNGWLQELPKPVTKLTWDNAAMISPKTAENLKVAHNVAWRGGEHGKVYSNVIDIALSNSKVTAAAWIVPGQADDTVVLPLGYGRKRAGYTGTNKGFNAYAVRTSGALWAAFAPSSAIRKTGQEYPLACTQYHFNMEGRQILATGTLEEYLKNPNFANEHAELPHQELSLYNGEAEFPYNRGKWAMAIDLNKCNGCNACVVACQSENNIPVVGKDQVMRGREMHWIRIDRYYAGKPGARKFSDTFRPENKQQLADWIDDPQAVTQPMLCQHCEAAPCENVCPVNATVHDQEGLNVMVYNRCVGTRYCSNNCPYKVRRFNYFDYNKRPLNALYRGPFGHRPDDEIDLIKMIKNPDVTVRMRGVMEKCTFCVQRIEGAKIAQKVKARDSGEVLVPEGTFTTACAQACPAGAITFGNLLDPESRVSKQKKQERNYVALEFLLTKPRTSYLARIRNQNPAMPDYYEWPLTFQEYEAKSGDPFQREALKREGAGEEGAEKGARP